MGATDSKLAFRKGVFRLFEERNIPSGADDYWNSFWALPETADDIYSLVGANDIRKTRDVAIENLETLIDKVIERINTIINAPTFPSTQHSTQHLLNCFRILSRIMPYIYESSEHSEWEDSFFWTPRTVERSPPVPESTPPSSDQTNNNNEEGTSSRDQKQVIEYDTLMPRGQQILSLLIQCLYLIGFTLPLNVTSKENTRILYIIWEDGVGSTTSLGSQRDIDTNRTEVLRTLIVFLSKSMYTSPSHILAKDDLWLNYVVRKLDRKTILVLLCSFMNTACKYDPLGWGVPYNHVLVANPREVLVAMCLRVLLILLDYRSPHVMELMHELDQQHQSLPITERRSNEGNNNDNTAGQNDNNKENGNNNDSSDATSISSNNPAASRASVDMQSILSSVDEINDTHDNPFKHYISKLHRPQDFKFLIDGIYRLLWNPLQASNTYLPRSTKRVQCNIEMIMLCWKLLECNQRFKNYLTESTRTLDLMVILIYYSIESKSNIAQVGVVRMCAFILQTLSSERQFGIKLNNPFIGHSSLPPIARIPAFHGTYGDYLICSIVNLIASTHGGLSSLYPAFILTIVNVSPYLKNLSVTTSNKLITLFNSLSSPGFMLADESNHRLTGYMMEVFNNIIQYHFADNPNFIYAIVRNHEKFEKLFNFTLSSGLAEIEHLRKLREERRQSTSSATATDITTSTEPINSNDSSSPSIQQDQESSTATNDETAIEQNKSPSSSKSPSLFGSYSLQRFVPTEEWVALWFPQFPTETIKVLLDYLVKQVEEKCTSEGLTTDAEVLQYLQTVTMVGILPQRHPIFIRKFQWGEALMVWFRSLIWGQFYISSMYQTQSPWNGTRVRLFQIRHEKPPSENTTTTTSSSSSSQENTFS
ncbi:high-temperature-induced dauer-formation protein-domain-containing protein [Cunninghamella echinulata]|nr:high-temperature-induced dauer-formation protein-domain-containing protein [Cunninghamella echinulata]